MKMFITVLLAEFLENERLVSAVKRTIFTPAELSTTVSIIKGVGDRNLDFFKVSYTCVRKIGNKILAASFTIRQKWTVQKTF